MERLPMKFTYCLGSASPRRFSTNERSRFPSPAASTIPQRIGTPVIDEVSKSISDIGGAILKPDEPRQHLYFDPPCGVGEFLFYLDSAQSDEAPFWAPAGAIMLASEAWLIGACPPRPYASLHRSAI